MALSQRNGSLIRATPFWTRHVIPGRAPARTRNLRYNFRIPGSTLRVAPEW